METQEARVYGPYFNGEKQVYADPLEVYHLLQQGTRGLLYKLLRDTREKGPEALASDSDEVKKQKAFERDSVTLDIVYPALESLAVAARLAFKMVPFDAATGQGATMRDCTAALFGFMAWLSSEKKSPRPATSPISSAPTAPPSSPLARPSSSDCGCS